MTRLTRADLIRSTFLSRPAFILPDVRDELIAEAFVSAAGSGGGLKGLVATALGRSDDAPKLAAMAGDELAALGDGLFESVSGGVAVLRVAGVLYPRAYFHKEELCVDGYDRIGAAIAAAADRDDISHLVLDLESPGGAAMGLFDLVRFAQSRIAQSGLQVTAFVRDYACSAAYAIASLAPRIIIGEVAIVGSVGAVAMRFDLSGFLDKHGVRAEPTIYGAHKIDGDGTTAFTDPERERLARGMVPLGDAFVRLVATARGLSFDAVRGWEAGVFTGPQALDAGLADGFGSLASVVAGAVGGMRDVKSGRSGLAEPLRAESKQPQPEAAAPKAAPSTADQRPDMLKLSATTLATLKATAEDASLTAEERKAARTLLAGAGVHLESEGADSEDEDQPAAEGPDDPDSDEGGEGGNPDDDNSDDEGPDAEGDDEDPDMVDEEEDSAKAGAARATAILGLPDAKGREQLATELAKGGYSVAAAKRLLAASPKSDAGLNRIRNNSQPPLRDGAGAQAKGDAALAGRIAGAKAKLNTRRR